MTQIQRFTPAGHITTGDSLARANKIKLEEMLQAGRTKVASTIENVGNNLPSDTVTDNNRITFTPFEGKVIMGTGDKALSLHRNAVGQLAEFADVPVALFTKFLGRKDGGVEWGAEMCADVLQKTFLHNVEPGKKLLVRHVGKEARAVLSDRYKRLDSGMILESFLSGAKQWGIMPYEGHSTDTRWYIRGLLDRLIEPSPGEFYAYGTSLGHSDYGDGALEMRAYFTRLVCTNGAMAENALRQVHLGKRLGDDITYSQETYRLESATSASAIKDIFGSLFSEEAIERRMANIGVSYKEKVEPKKQVEHAVKALGSKELAAKIVEQFTSADIEMMPAGQTKARWAQAASLLANSEDDVEKKMKLQSYAALVMGFSVNEKTVAA